MSDSDAPFPQQVPRLGSEPAPPAAHRVLSAPCEAGTGITCITVQAADAEQVKSPAPGHTAAWGGQGQPRTARGAAARGTISGGRGGAHELCLREGEAQRGRSPLSAALSLRQGRWWVASRGQASLPGSVLVSRGGAPPAGSGRRQRQTLAQEQGRAGSSKSKEPEEEPGLSQARLTGFSPAFSPQSHTAVGVLGSPLLPGKPGCIPAPSQHTGHRAWPRDGDQQQGPARTPRVPAAPPCDLCGGLGPPQ